MVGGSGVGNRAPAKPLQRHRDEFSRRRGMLPATQRLVWQTGGSGAVVRRGVREPRGAYARAFYAARRGARRSAFDGKKRGFE